MVKRRPKKRASTPRPYNNKTMSESEVRWAILQKLRMLTSWWKPKSACITKSWWVCIACKGVFPKKEMKADHILPIVPTDWWKKTDDLFLWYNWNEWLRNAFVEVDDYQAMCKNCHDIKSKKENADRKAFKDLIK